MRVNWWTESVAGCVEVRSFQVDNGEYVDENQEMREKGLHFTQGNNVVTEHTSLEAVTTRLGDTGKLPDDAPSDILVGLAKCSH